ncbi:Flp pilus assembly complex ATPase component TadA [Candidatus Kuenenbacteria bacterium]|nr:Flp pilus assembly complex ATPase component TadA [Candidatus Kuenenbacteria bacterium]
MKKPEELKEKILAHFLAQKKITTSEVDQLKLENTLANLEQGLLKNKNISEEDITEAKASIFNLPHILLGDERIPSAVLNIFPKDLAENYQMVVFAKDGDQLKVALVDPLNLKAREAADFVAHGKNYRINYYITSLASFSRVLQQYGSLKTEVTEALKIAENKFDVEEQSDDKMDKIIKAAPISKMVSVILKHAVELRASDVHIEPTTGETRVRYRIDGLLQTSLSLPKYVHAAIISRIKVMANLKIDETRVPQDGRIRLNINNKNIDFRISTLPLYSQEKVVMRILDTSKGVSTWEDLGFEGKNLELMYENIAKPHGMFLVTGPTGSGKSTTLYAALNLLNKEEVNIVTLEDPVEYYLTGVNQAQVRPEVKFTFASGLRSILRQDPDIIMVGEIRDAETAELAIHASLTGHFVLSTLHTNDAFGAIPRLMDMKIEPFLLASTLNVIIAQRLVRTICADCKETIPMPKTLLGQVQEIFDSLPKQSIPQGLSADNLKNIYHGKGCSHCDHTGYKGRMAIVEVLNVSEEIKNIIYSGSSLSKINELFSQQGMLTLKQDGIIKALEGRTTIEEVLAVTKE